MDDIWYYAEGDKPVGPLSLPDMTAILSRISDAKDVFVWREGFSNWIKAENVPDLAPYVIKPPASPNSPPRWLQPARTSPIVVDEVRAKYAPSENKQGDLVGIGGWLILVAIGQVLGPLMFAAHLFKYYEYLNTDLWMEFSIAVYGEAVLNLSVLAIMGLATYLFFTKSGLFPAFFIYECAAYIILFPLGTAFKAAAISAYGRSFHITLASKPVGEWIMAIILAAVWISYIKSSKRVANTFGK